MAQNNFFKSNLLLIMTKIKILIAGIAGASLGTEIAKSLLFSARYALYGCDISPLAYGHCSDMFADTFLLKEESYIQSILKICLDNGITYVIPGGESPMVLLSAQANYFMSHGITIIGNNPGVINTCSDKNILFEFLKNHDVPIPESRRIITIDDIAGFQFPCIIKPSKDSGGSNFVFLAKNQEELENYCNYLLANKMTPIIQEYIPHHEGEFTVGVLSTQNKKIIGSIALKRLFNSKLSVSIKTQDHLISSGYSQGLIDSFHSICKTAEQIAALIGSTGPINVQGRLKNGVFVPFEINPRFSASTYLRTMAGFNEIDFYITHLETGKEDFAYQIKSGYYLRTFTESYTEKGKLEA